MLDEVIIGNLNCNPLLHWDLSLPLMHARKARTLRQFSPALFCPSVPLLPPSVLANIKYPSHHTTPAGLPPSSFRPPSCSCYVTRPTAGQAAAPTTLIAIPIILRLHSSRAPLLCSYWPRLPPLRARSALSKFSLCKVFSMNQM